MDETRPIDRYRSCISDLQGLREVFLDLSKRSPLRHQLILWQGAGKPPTQEGWKKLLLEVGILPYKAKTPDEHVRFEFSDPSNCHGFRCKDKSRSV